MPATGSRAMSTAIAPENGGGTATASRPFGCETTTTAELFDDQPTLGSTRGRHRYCRCRWRKRRARCRRRRCGTEGADHRVRHDLAVLVDLSDAQWKDGMSEGVQRWPARTVRGALPRREKTHRDRHAAEARERDVVSIELSGSHALS